MCFNWFKKTEVIQPAITDNTIYHFAAGDYAGYENDLDGPSHDQKRMVTAISERWTNYVYRKYLDNTTKTATFFADLDACVDHIQPGDLLVFINDLCFAGTNTDNTTGIRSMGINPVKVKVLAERFIKGPEVSLNTKVRSMALRDIGAGNYISMSACLPEQTALDVEINGTPTGLYHQALIETMERGITYKQWTERSRQYVTTLGFDRLPIIEGPDSLINRMIFEGNVHCFILSMHGSWDKDISGDESDFRDEGPYFPDGFIRDDRINEAIAKNEWLC
jgi:hypothetical protein